MVMLGCSYVANTIDPASQTSSSSQGLCLWNVETDNKSRLEYKYFGKAHLADQNKPANDAIVDRGGDTYQISANKEVMVSVGTLSLSSISFPHM